MKQPSWLFVVVAGFFVTSLVVSNIIAVKLVEVSGQVFPAGLVVFPLAYILGDVLTEVYGFRAARAVIWLGFACNCLLYTSPSPRDGLLSRMPSSA